MSRKIFIITMLVLGFILSMHAQRAIVKGLVKDVSNNEPVAFATVLVVGTTNGTTTDLDGNYVLEIEPGIYTFEVSYIGLKSVRKTEIEVNTIRPTVIDFEMSSSELAIEEVVVKADPFNKPLESPVSLRSIGVSEIRRNPGGNRDISKVVQSLPGVTATTGYRNDLIIRGGAPNENRFYLDGIEVPNINHYATQGAGGGPAGLINVNFIREVDFYSGAFPANTYNSLSSVFEFKQRDGRDDRIGGSVIISGTDAGISLEGPIGEKTTFLASARRSYLGVLFQQLGLPFLPTYNDFQVKTRTKINKNNEIIFVGLGAVDQFELNYEAGVDESSLYLLDNLPETPQWNYTNGVIYKNFHKQGVRKVILSRNMLNNRSFKYQDNDKSSEENLILDYTSQEIENKLRLEDQRTVSDYKVSYGVSYEFVKYTNSTFNKIFTQGSGAQTVNFNSELSFSKYGLFGQVSRSYLKEKLRVSAGLRMDGNTYSNLMSNPLDQVSPRLSLSYVISPSFSINANTGIYYQLPSYPLMGYRDNNDVLVNKENGIKYIRNHHYVAGIEWNTAKSSRVTVEGYYKRYNDYPFLLRDSVTLANLGGDFGVVGNEPGVSTSEGQTYGMELLFQQKLYKGFYGIAAYTLGWSQFEDKNNSLVASSWDARHIVSLTLGKQFAKNWEIGTALRFQSGLPRTPFSDQSSLVTSWDVNKRAILDYNLINTERNNSNFGLDIRIDKKWFFKKWNLNVYADVENVTASAPESTALVLDRELDADGLPIGGGVIINPDAPIEEQRYKLKEISVSTGTVIPSLGVQIDF